MAKIGILSMNRTSVIRVDPKQLFFYFRLPLELNQKYTTLGQKLVGKEKAENNDHISLLYLPARDSEISLEERVAVLDTAKKLASKFAPIKAKIQGWAYFDAAVEDLNSSTVLVALIDAPGLADLHVALKHEMNDLGFKFDQTHGFTPHATFAYLKQGQRVDNLPILDDEFSISSFELSNNKIYEFELNG
jgi:2'-5' RNA ligase